MYLIGMQPGSVFTADDIKKGKGAAAGTRHTDQAGREYLMVEIATGHTILPNRMLHVNAVGSKAVLTTAAAAGVPNVGSLALNVASVTAHAGEFTWAQVFGEADVHFDATASATPGAALKLGANGGVTAASVTTASAYVAGMNVLATVSAVGLGRVFLNYPRAISG